METVLEQCTNLTAATSKCALPIPVRWITEPRWTEAPRCKGTACWERDMEPWQHGTKARENFAWENRPNQSGEQSLCSVTAQYVSQPMPEAVPLKLLLCNYFDLLTSHFPQVPTKNPKTYKYVVNTKKGENPAGCEGDSHNPSIQEAEAGSRLPGHTGL